MSSGHQASEFGPPLYLAEIFHAVAKQYKLIAAIMVLFLAAGAAYGILAERQFTARVTLLPVNSGQDQSAINGALSSALSRFGGIFDKGQPTGNAEIALELAKTREFVKDLLVKYPQLNAQLLPDCTVTVSDNGPSQKAECSLNDIWKASSRWQQDIFRHGMNEDNGLYWVEVTLPDPLVASKVANTAVLMMDQRMRTLSLEQSSENIKYLSDQLQATLQADVRTTITGLLQRQLEQQMLASNKNAYVFQVLEAAAPPAAPSAPRVPLIIIASVIIGLVFGTMVAFVRASRKVMSGQHQPVFTAAE